MKNYVVLFALSFIFFGTTYAQDMILPQEMTPEEVAPENLSNTDRQAIDQSELPSSVVRALDEGTYEGMVIAEAFVLQGEALKHATAETDRSDITPRVLYELQLWQGNNLSVVYFTQHGERYEADRSV